MDGSDDPASRQKRKSLKAATHILKKVALQRYRMKLGNAQSEESSLPDVSAVDTSETQIKATTSHDDNFGTEKISMSDCSDSDDDESDVSADITNRSKNISEFHFIPGAFNRGETSSTSVKNLAAANDSAKSYSRNNPVFVGKRNQKVDPGSREKNHMEEMDAEDEKPKVAPGNDAKEEVNNLGESEGVISLDKNEDKSGKDAVAADAKEKDETPSLREEEAKVEDALTKEEDAQAKVKDIPAKEETTSEDAHGTSQEVAKVEDAPTKEETKPEDAQATSQEESKVEDAPAKEENTPQEDAQATSQEESKVEDAPAKEKNTPQEDAQATSQEESKVEDAPAKEENKPQEDAQTTSQEEAMVEDTLAKEDTAPADKQASQEVVKEEIPAVESGSHRQKDEVAKEDQSEDSAGRVETPTEQPPLPSDESEGKDLPDGSPNNKEQSQDDVPVDVEQVQPTGDSSKNPTVDTVATEQDETKEDVQPQSAESSSEDKAEKEEERSPDAAEDGDRAKSPAADEEKVNASDEKGTSDAVQDESPPDEEKKDDEKDAKPSSEEEIAGTQPPIIEVVADEELATSEVAVSKEEGPSEDFYYESEEYQSRSVVSTDSGIPLNMLQFFHSFGYDCKKRSNLYLLHGPTALFAAGNLVHLLNLASGDHQFLRSCSGGGVGALTVHPSGKYFVVAEKGVKPYLLIYEFPSLKLYRILRGGTERAYSFVDFDPKGNLLASVGSAPDYMLTVWDWKKEKIMLRSKAFSQEIYRVTFSPEQEGLLTSCGTTHIRFWKMAWTFTGLKLKGELGRFGKTSLSDIEGYIQLPDGKVLSGSDWGNFLLWDGGLIKVEICRKNQKPCHVGSVQQLVIDEGELITIGVDGYVRVWEMEAIDSADTTDDSDLFEVEPMNELKVGNDVQLTSMVKASRAEDDSLEEGASIWFAQDANGGIWKLDLSFSHTTKPPEMLYSCTAGAITGVSCSPTSHLVSMTGDAYVRVYDYLTKQLLCHYHSPTPHTTGTSLLWPNKVIDPKGTTIVAGFSDGILRLLNLRQVDDTNELVLKQAMKPHSSSITAMAFDNSGEILATGSTDCTVFFFSVDHDKYDPIGFVKIPGEVTNMKWTPPGFPDTRLLVTCSNGKVVEVEPPTSTDTSHSFMLDNVAMKYFTFQSVKSRLRRDEQRERREKEKAQRRKEREKELKRRKDRGEEISEEEAQTFLDEDPQADAENEEEPLYIPPDPCPVLEAVYTIPGRFFVSMADYDAGYLYECAFPDDASDPNAMIEPLRAVSVEDSSDVPLTSIRFTADRRKLVAGLQNGLIRVYPLEGDPETAFDLDMLKSHWDLNMHDNDNGAVTHIVESHDGAHLFSSGSDGNLFGYLSLSHEEIAKAMEGKRAKLPTPKKRSPDDRLVDDIDDPHAYSIEDAKLKAEHDKMIRDAEAKKLAERRKIGKLRKTFLELLQKNEELPPSVQLQRNEFELDPSLRGKMVAETHEKVNRVRLEMQWDKAKLALTHDKLHKRFRSQLECDRVTVHSFNTSHVVSSYRVGKLADEYHSLRETVEQRVRAASLASEGGAVGLLDGATASLASDKQKADTESIEESFLNGAKQNRRQTILQGRQAEKVAKAIKKSEEVKLKREKRQKEWEELYKSKPDEQFEDPADVAAIREAQANMGDFKLKTAPDYVVPEHLRMDTEKKRYQILVLQGLVHRTKSEFNEKLLALRDGKLSMIDEMKSYVADLKTLQSKMEKSDRVAPPVIPRPHPDEEPHRKFEYTRASLLRFEEEERQREIDAAKKKRTGDGGLFGGFGDQDDEQEPTSKAGYESSKKGASSIASSALSKAPKMAQGKVAPAPTALELQVSQIERIRLKYQRDRLLRLIDKNMTSFDAELRLLRHNKFKVDVSLKMADLRQVTLLEELLLLKEYEKRETTLSGRVVSKRIELTEINTKAADMQIKLETKRRDIERLSDREKALYASFAASLGENNKFADFLNKVFRKKIKRAKKKVVEEGEEADSDVTSSDESDWSSEEDEDDSVEGGFDDSMCPPGCDQILFDSALALREKRLDLEEALVEEKKVAETLKKDSDALGKKAKVMESQLKTALADLEAFQVEKQGKLNELDIIVPLRLHQVEHVYNAIVPSDLSQCLIFANNSLTSLQRRIKELQQEKNEERKFYKEARQQHVHLIKNRRIMEERIEQMEEKCEHMMMLKFGRIVDLEKLDAVTINRNVEELKEQVRRNEAKNAQEILKREKRINRLKDQVTDLTRANTKRLEALNVLVNDKDELEQELDKRQRTMDLGQGVRRKPDMKEQHRLVQLVQLQAQEIQALKEEIGLLSRKGGHILPPAQPPLGQDPDVM
ncbi:unnamed protein product [Clavelina lepadiformis]|uniref:Cilia- and flagella-associated protein 44 n=1 Tax=Clavelina lepadiformis TaxID=159417 RepID=A0ABP0G5I3_CLALP